MVWSADMRRLPIFALVCALGCAACARTAGPPVDVQRPGGTTSPPGTIVIDGSGTVAPITSALAEEFTHTAEGRGIRISVGVSGTGGGFKKFCSTTAELRTDIQDASRPIREEEDRACRRAQVRYIELPVAIDGIAVVVNPSNTWVQCLTVGELRRIWEPAAEERIVRWRQVRSTFPDRPLRLAGPGADSGTFDTFTEVVVGQAKASRGDYQATANHNITVQFVARDPDALGYFGLSYLERNLGRVKAVPIDPSNRVNLASDAECRGIPPRSETVGSGQYRPLTRPLFFYVNYVSAQTRTEVRAFMRFAFGPNGLRRILRSVGYVEFPQEVYDLALRCFMAPHAGTAFIWSGRPAGHASVEDVIREIRRLCS